MDNEEKECKNYGYKTALGIFISLFIILIILLIAELFNRIPPSKCASIPSEYSVKAGISSNDSNTSCKISGNTNIKTVSNLEDALKACTNLSCCKFFNYNSSAKSMEVVNGTDNVSFDTKTDIYIKNIG